MYSWKASKHAYLRSMWLAGEWILLVYIVIECVHTSPASECICPQTTCFCNSFQSLPFGLQETLCGPVQRVGRPWGFDFTFLSSRLPYPHGRLVPEYESPAPLPWVQTHSHDPFKLLWDQTEAVYPSQVRNEIQMFKEKKRGQCDFIVCKGEDGGEAPHHSPSAGGQAALAIVSPVSAWEREESGEVSSLTYSTPSMEWSL